MEYAWAIYLCVCICTVPVFCYVEQMVDNYCIIYHITFFFFFKSKQCLLFFQQYMKRSFHWDQEKTMSNYHTFSRQDLLAFGQALSVWHRWNNYWTFLPMSICSYHFWKAFVFVWAPTDGSEVKIWLLFISQVQNWQDREGERKSMYWLLPFTSNMYLLAIHDISEYKLFSNFPVQTSRK